MSTPKARDSRRLPIVVVTTLHALGVAGLVFAFSRANAGIDPLVFASVCLAAYALGLRHAFDADHIAVIDNTTRRLLATGRPSRAVGLFFSLGHSSVVVALCIALAAGAYWLTPMLEDDGSELHAVTSIVGPVVSGVVISILAITNIVLLVRSRRDGAAPAGVWSAMIGRMSWAVDRPWRMYLVGFVFGLGFDTATEIGLLGIATTAAAGHAAWYAVLTLPIAFAAGMSMLDSMQGELARRVYQRNATARSGANLVVTGVSAVVALVVGLSELGEVAATNVPALSWLPPLDVDALGFVLTGVLIVATVAALVTTRRRVRNGRRRSPAVPPSADA